MFVSLNYGDHLPTVALAQSMLVAHGFEVQIDGHYGNATREAVRAFQLRGNLTPARGLITPRTWDALALTSPPRTLRVVEQIDGSDAIGFLSSTPRSAERVASEVITPWVTDPPWVTRNRSVVHVEQGGRLSLFDRLPSAHPASSVDLLRFHGHGAPGHQSLFWGTSFHHMTISTPYMQATLMRLGAIMKPTGSIELHGCNTGMGARGRRMLQAMANATRVPVSAGRALQYGGDASHVFEGAVVTCCPSERSLADWARATFTGSGR